MSTVFLEEASFESDEVIADAELFEQTRVVPDNPLYTQDYNDMDLVFASYSGILNRGVVCRDDIQKVQHLADKYPSLKKLLQKYPVGSFTADPSSINYAVSTEGFVSTAYNAVVKVLRDILNFIVRSFKRLWEFLNGNERRTIAIDNLADRVMAVQDYLLNVDKAINGLGITDEYRKVRQGAIANSLQNLNKGWREIHTFFIEKPEDRNKALDAITGALKVTIPPFIHAVDEFMNDLVKAETEVDIREAIETLKLLNLGNSNLTDLATTYGYSKRDIRVDSRMSDFQSVTNYIQGYMKSLASRHGQLSKEKYSELILNMQIDEWSKEIIETIKWSSAKTGPVLDRLANFSDSALKPGLQDSYAIHLTSFFGNITSTVQAFTELENALAQLVEARNEATLKIAKGGLETAKIIDKFLTANKGKLNISAANYINKYRENLRKLF